MSLQIFYTPRSKETLALVYNFISNEFGSKSADKFAAKPKKILHL
jgi:hypothetical protein